MVRELRENITIPMVFMTYADLQGSAFMRLIAGHGAQAVEPLSELAKSLKEAITGA